MRSVFALLFLLLYGMAGRSFTLNSSTNPNLKGWSSSNIKIYFAINISDNYENRYQYLIGNGGGQFVYEYTKNELK